MKLLYTLIILFAFSFATTYSIEYSRKGLFSSEKLIVVNHVQFKRQVGHNLIFSNSTPSFGENIIEVDCRNLISITDFENKKEYNDCRSFLMEINNKKTGREINNKKTDRNSKTNDNGKIIGTYKSPLRAMGGLSIAMGSVLLINNLDNECSNCDSIEKINDFGENLKSQQKIAYTFILIGGLLIGFSE